MGAPTTGKTGLLTRLARDRAGNTLAITAAAIVPLIALIGGGVDISRIYLTKTRLQQACDAGALAGRKSMSGITWTTGDNGNEGTAKSFFRMNFPNGKFGAGNPSINYTASNTGAVSGVATITVPMTLMAFFNAGDKTLTANCTADLQLPNTDVMFVLDTTLSMNETNPGDTQTKLQVLKDSVKNFYTQLQQVKPAGSHIRYGFVPYSSTVNVGMLLKRAWIQDDPWYDSREPDGMVAGTGTKTTTVTETLSKKSGSYTEGSYLGSPEKCVSPPAESYTDVYSGWSAWDPSDTAVPRSRTGIRTRNGKVYGNSLKNGVCTISWTLYDQYVNDAKQTFKEVSNSDIYHWIYRPIQYSTALLKGAGDSNAPVMGGTFTALKIANNFQDRKIIWDQTNACIEERKTRRSDEAASVQRYDMDIDLVPNPADADTQWKPFLPGVVYGRRASGATSTSGWEYSGASPTKTRDISSTGTLNYYSPFGATSDYAACPTRALKLQEISQTTLWQYIDSLTAAGFTYHDIGMLWGLRLMSPQGLFAAEHQAAEASGKIARHLIFMTDGDTDTRIGAYDAWGVSAVARRRTPTGATPTNAQQNTLTEQRLKELCAVARDNKNITVWVIAFGTDLTQLLKDCASPDRAYYAKDSAQLNATFSQIASQIAQLRITR